MMRQTHLKMSWTQTPDPEARVSCSVTLTSDADRSKTGGKKINILDDEKNLQMKEHFAVLQHLKKPDTK